MKCLKCNKKMNVKTAKYHYTESGLDNVYIKTRIYRCDKCKEVIADIPVMHELHELIAKYLVEKDSLLIGKEIKFLRKEMHFKANELANMLGVTKVTISRWGNDKEKISPYNDKLIRLLYIQILQEKHNKIFGNVLAKLKNVSPTFRKKTIFIPDIKIKAEHCDLSHSR